MGTDSKIEWTNHTFNPWVGCQKVSAGCLFCYAERDMTRKTRWQNAWGPPFTSRRVKTKTWGQPLQWNRLAEKNQCRYRVFCASLGDVFEDNDQLVPWRLELWELINQTPNLDWLLLTKRPENVLGLAAREWITGIWPSNVWLGASVEDQNTYDVRVPDLCETAGRLEIDVTFLSIEPMLGPIDMDWGYYAVSWIIVGGESGPNARPMHPDWPRIIRDQCVAAGTPYFFKQWGRWAPSGHCDDESWFSAEKLLVSPLAQNVPAALIGAGDVLMASVGKKKAGRSLDGVEWSQFP